MSSGGVVWLYYVHVYLLPTPFFSLNRNRAPESISAALVPYYY
jgi:hypothetical protein